MHPRLTEKIINLNFYQRAALCARWSRGPVSSGKLLEIEAFRGNYDTGTYGIEASELKFEVRSDLEVIWRPPWPQRLPKWLLEAICTYIPG